MYNSLLWLEKWPRCDILYQSGQVNKYVLMYVCSTIVSKFGVGTIENFEGVEDFSVHEFSKSNKQILLHFNNYINVIDSHRDKNVILVLSWL